MRGLDVLGTDRLSVEVFQDDLIHGIGFGGWRYHISMVLAILRRKEGRMALGWIRATGSDYISGVFVLVVSDKLVPK